MSVRALWNFRKLATLPYAAQVPIELTKYAQTDVFTRLLVRVFGNLTTTGTFGAASGADNPEGLLTSAVLQTSPQVAGVVPINAVSGRGLRWDAALNRGFIITPLAITAAAQTAAKIDFTYELIFIRRRVKKGIEYGLDMSKYTSALLTLNFGDIATTLFAIGTGVGSLVGQMNVEIYADSNFAVNAAQQHSTELFEQNFPVLASQSDFPINQLPPGFLYTDLCFITESNGIPVNTVLNNIDIEGGGRIWTPAGDNNAAEIQRSMTVPLFDGGATVYQDTNVPGKLAGIYAIPLRDGMFSRAIDALTDPILIKLNVNLVGTTNVRLLGRRMIPGAVRRKATAPAVKK